MNTMKRQQRTDWKQNEAKNAQSASIFMKDKVS